MKGSFVNNIIERLLSKYYSKSVTGLPMLKDETKYQVCHHFKTKLIDLDKELPELENNNNYTPILGTGIAGQLLATRRSTRTNDCDVIQLDEITSVRIKLDGETFKEQEYPDPIPLFVRNPVEEDDNEDNDEQEVKEQAKKRQKTKQQTNEEIKTDFALDAGKKYKKRLA